MAPLPEWAKPLKSRGRANELLKIAESVITHRYGAPVVNDRLGTLEVPGGPVFGMYNLAHIAAESPRAGWRLLVYDVISSLDQLAPARIEALVRDWEQVRPLLRTRIYGVVGLPVDVEAVTRPLGPTSQLGLGVALDRTMVMVAREHARSWEVSMDEAFEVATRNVLERVPVDHTMMLKDDHCFALIEGKGLAVTGHAMDLTVALGDMGPDPDVAVFAPCAHNLFVMPLQGPDLTGRLRVMHRLAAEWAAQNPNGVTLDVLRYRGPRRLSYEPKWAPNQRLRPAIT
jgi:hypothetical protein